MPHTAATLKFIEHMAQEQFRYQQIFNTQQVVLQTDVPSLQAAMARIQRSPIVSQDGRGWQPAEDKADEYLAKCDELCSLVPRNFDDRVKIVHAAHASLMCLLKCKIASQPESVKLAIIKRNHELDRAATHVLPDVAAAALDNSLSKLTTDPIPITATELKFFRNPENLYGKQFILSPGAEDSVFYEVVGYCRKRDKSIQFEVLYEGCRDTITTSQEEMTAMLRDSMYFPPPDVEVS